MKIDKNLCLQLGIIALCLIQITLLSFFNEYLLLAVVGAITLLAYKILPKQAKTYYYEKECLLIIASFLLGYYVITYLLGFFIGFVYSSYSRTLLGILNNVAMYTILAIEIEFLRYILINPSKKRNKKNLLSCITLSLIEITTVFSIHLMTSKTAILESFLGNVLPIISLNVLLTYLSTRTNKKNTLLMHLGLYLPIYILPVFPNLGDYVRTLLLIILPVMVIITLETSIFHKKESANARSYKRDVILERIIQGVSIVLLVTVIYFVSGIGRYNAFAIGSISMQGTINKGDLVVIDKQATKYEIGDIIAFEKDGKKIVHRIVNIQTINNKNYYVTKGDTNETNDDWIVREEELIGLYKFRLLGLGWPTVSLSEALAE